MRPEFMILLVVVFIAATTVAIATFAEQRQAEACADAGGFYIDTLQGEACIDPNALIEEY